jgi:hypothetical protein
MVQWFRELIGERSHAWDHNTIETHNSLEVLRCGEHAFMWCYGFMDEAAPVLDAGAGVDHSDFPESVNPQNWAWDRAQA